jgi:hypothetical protein
VTVDGHLRDAGGVGNGVDAGPFETVHLEVPARRFQDAPDALGIARPAALRAGWDIVVGRGHGGWMI